MEARLSGCVMSDAVDSSGALEFPPRPVRIVGWFAVPGTLLFALDLLYAQTVHAWQSGPFEVSYTMALGHSSPLWPLALLTACSVLVAHGVLAVVFVSAFLGAAHRRRSGRVRPLACLLLLSSVGIIYVPQGAWQLGMVELLGQGPHTGEFLVGAALRGESEVVRGLLNHGVPVDAELSNGTTALEATCRNKNITLAKFLLSRGAQVKLAPACDWIEEIVPHPDRVHGPDQRIEVH